MAFSDTFLPEFDHEMRTTRSILERVPTDKSDWRPHPKSTALGVLAAHVAGLVRFGSRVASEDEINMAPADGSPPRPPAPYDSTDALLAAFDESVAATRSALSSLPDEKLTTPWTLKFGEQTIFTMPRAAVLRMMLMSHVIHHRGQLSVYLRLNDVPLPSIYGPTADS
jgi:uncharacterized damage-inducible protein DinB